MTPIWAVSLSVCAVRFWLLWITSRYILYIYNYPRERECVYTRARVSAICVYVHTCVSVCMCVRARRLGVYCTVVYFSVCVCVRGDVTRLYVLARTHRGNRARRGAMDSKTKWSGPPRTSPSRFHHLSHSVAAPLFLRFFPFFFFLFFF